MHPSHQKDENKQVVILSRRAKVHVHRFMLCQCYEEPAHQQVRSGHELALLVHVLIRTEPSALFKTTASKYNEFQGITNKHLVCITKKFFRNCCNTIKMFCITMPSKTRCEIFFASLYDCGTTHYSRENWRSKANRTSGWVTPENSKHAQHNVTRRRPQRLNTGWVCNQYAGQCSGLPTRAPAGAVSSPSPGRVKTVPCSHTETQTTTTITRAPAARWDRAPALDHRDAVCSPDHPGRGEPAAPGRGS